MARRPEIPREIVLLEEDWKNKWITILHLSLNEAQAGLGISKTGFSLRYYWEWVAMCEPISKHKYDFWHEIDIQKSSNRNHKDDKRSQSIESWLRQMETFKVKEEL